MASEHAKLLEWIEFDLPPGTTRAEALALYRGTATVWAANPDLVGKTYTFNEATSTGGGLYIWRSREAAARWHGEDYRRVIRSRYGSEPRIRMTDAVLEVTDGQILDLPGND